MKYNNKTVLFLLLTLMAACSLMAREKFNFNGGWRYAQGDFACAENPAFDDSGWTSTGLPHSFSIPYFMAPDFYVGYGWYRKCFQLAHKALDGRVMLEFDGVFQDVEVFVNGVKVGAHKGGYTGFDIDITDACRAGNNLVAVRVNNLWKPDLAPRAGEHTFSGGIYRNVRLVTKNNAYIPQYGIGVTTPNLAQNNGKGSVVAINAEVTNASTERADYTLKCSVYDKNDNEVTDVSKNITVNPSDTALMVMRTPYVADPELWDIDNPARYKVVSNLYSGDNLLDSDTTRFGFRWMEWTADRGFFLNGKHLYLQGANVHQDHAGWGDAVTDGAAIRDVKMMKEAGFNFIRGSHYPHSPAFTEACDSVGILFWSEAPFWGIGGFKPDGYWNSSAYPVDSCYEAAFNASAINQLAEMIRIHRNRPSVIVWSMCNETFFSAPKAMDGVRNALAGVLPPQWPSEGMPAKLKLTASSNGPVKADGTDDVHLLVSVIGADGNDLSNSPDVSLKIISGPGEFPTGRSISFSKNSDICILDGKAAIEMRAYRSGHTIVEATSPGLEPARLAIDFVNGIDPGYREPKERPYIRFEKRVSAKEPVVFGRNNPMFASGSAAQHASGLAGDGDESTWWESAPDDRQPSLMLDTEKGLSLKTIYLVFPEKANWKYRVETSLNGKTWNILTSCNGETATKTMTFECEKEVKAQFVRIAFDDSGAVAELSVTGIILD